MRILYDSKNNFFKSPFGCIAKGEKCTMRIMIPSSCGAKNARVVLEGEANLSFAMEYMYSKDAYDVFEAGFCLNETGIYFYYFRIADSNGEYQLRKQGFDGTNIGEGDMWQVSCIPRDFAVPERFKGRVMYQIFPDRFKKSGTSDCAGKLTPYIVHTSTQEAPEFRPDKNGEILNNDFFGGNLRGIKEALPYIKSLGVRIIYLNPIFKAFSNHRYDTCDYMTIDPMLGNEDDFRALCKDAHRLGISVILDGVFSHTGSDSIYFDIKNRFGNGAYHNENSPYREWYKWVENGYESWWGISTLPCTDELCPSFVQYIITGENSVIKHWLSLGADGFRLDVADELPDEFIALLRREVKRAKPDALVIGEVWEDASNKTAYGIMRKYFAEGEIDSVMNYPFRDAIIALVTGNSPAEEFAHRIMTICENYPAQALSCLMNSLSTHDTARILTVLSGADTNISREEMHRRTLSDEELSTAKKRIMPAIVLLFFLEGCACIYYGDERGMTGFPDPFNRAFLDARTKDGEIFCLYRKMAQIKNRNSVFRDGRTHFLTASDGVVAIERTNGKESVSCVINLSDGDVCVHARTPLVSHNVSCLKENSCHVHKYGFVLY